jgi:tetratricopeptide (TPR) repeat protein
LVAASATDLGFVLCVQTKYAECALQFEHAAAVMANIAAVYSTSHKNKEAEELYRRALAIDRKVYSAVSAAVPRDLNNLGSVYHNMHREREAEETLGRALATHDQVFGSKHPASD